MCGQHQHDTTTTTEAVEVTGELPGHGGTPVAKSAAA